MQTEILWILLVKDSFSLNLDLLSITSLVKLYTYSLLLTYSLSTADQFEEVGYAQLILSAFLIILQISIFALYYRSEIMESGLLFDFAHKL